MYKAKDICNTIIQASSEPLRQVNNKNSGYSPLPFIKGLDEFSVVSKGRAGTNGWKIQQGRFQFNIMENSTKPLLSKTGMDCL